MSALDEIIAAASQDFKLTYTVSDIEGPQINVGEEFSVHFRIQVTSYKFRWQYVALQVIPNFDVVEVVPGQDFAEGTLSGETVYTKHLENFDFAGSESLRFRAKARLVPMRNSFCHAMVFARDGHLRVWNSRKPRIYCVAYIGPRMVRCENGHEYREEDDFTFCPIDGLPLE
jgi:hypothetical protein